MKIMETVVVTTFSLDFVFKFFEEYEDEDFQKIDDFKSIAIKYAKSGWLVLDFLATFPFDIFIRQAMLTKLIRLLRLTKLIRLLDVNRVKRLVKGYYDKSTSSDRIQS